MRVPVGGRLLFCGPQAPATGPCWHAQYLEEVVGCSGLPAALPAWLTFLAQGEAHRTSPGLRSQAKRPDTACSREIRVAWGCRQDRVSLLQSTESRC